jgi:hypothetical protein
LIFGHDVTRVRIASRRFRRHLMVGMRIRLRGLGLHHVTRMRVDGRLW